MVLFSSSVFWWSTSTTPVLRGQSARRKLQRQPCYCAASLGGVNAPVERMDEVIKMTATESVLGLDFRLITPETELYMASAGDLEQLPCGEPYWGFCWPGSYALADYIDQNPHLVRGKRVLDVGSGCALASLAALRAGATHVIANDIDPWCSSAAAVNFRLNSRHLIDVSGFMELSETDLLCPSSLLTKSGTTVATGAQQADVILAGDICYEQPLATCVKEWILRQLLTTHKRSGQPSLQGPVTDAEEAVPVKVFIGDPGRQQFVESFLQVKEDSVHDLACRSSEEALSNLTVCKVHSVTPREKFVADTSYGMSDAQVWQVALNNHHI